MAGEGAQQKITLESSERSDPTSEPMPVIGENGIPLAVISCAAAELVPTVQYGNVTIGPIKVTRWVPDLGDDTLKEEINKTQSLCEQAVAADRKSVHALTVQSQQGRYNS